MSWENLKVKVFTWNCAGNAPPSPQFDISHLILPPEESQIVPDIYVIGLQEMVKLNAKSVIKGKDKERVLLWEDIVVRSICRGHRYVCVSKKPMVGCLVMLFVKDEHKHNISCIRTSRVKTGLAGSAGNKGAVAIRFNYANTSFAFINCHLTSGQSQISERLQDINEIYKRSFDCSQKYQDFQIYSHDYKFLFGDLNFRIALSYEQTIAEIERRNYPLLQSKD